MAKATPKMEFDYFAGEQKSPEWFKIRLGKVTASRLEDWLSVSQAERTKGKPLQKRKDYEKELMFERQFGVSFETFVSGPMQDGIVYEDFMRQEYEKIKSVQAEPCGCWYNKYFVASPDAIIALDGEALPGQNNIGLLEIKVLKDNNFTEVLRSGVLPKHWKQIQGQLWASSAKWCDYVVGNLNSKKIKIIRVLPDAEFHEWLELAVAEPLTAEKFDLAETYDFLDALPEPQFDAIAAKQGISVVSGKGVAPKLTVTKKTKAEGAW